MPQTLFIIGDVHGCYHTFRELVEAHWRPETMTLIQLGDLTDRGKHIPRLIEYARDLEAKYPDGVTFLKGNHESMTLEVWDVIQRVSRPLANIYARESETLHQYFANQTARARLKDDMDWLALRPLFWENENVFVSHAGISAVWNGVEEALDNHHPESILWTRSRLKNLGKTQVIGHTPLITGKPQFREEENCWNIDTAAVFGLNLTALHLGSDGAVLNVFSHPTKQIDYF